MSRRVDVGQDFLKPWKVVVHKGTLNLSPSGRLLQGHKVYCKKMLTELGVPGDYSLGPGNSKPRWFSWLVDVINRLGRKKPHAC